MIAKQFLLCIAREITVDLFAGGGGASTGIEQALGRHVDIAMNHDPQAISLHTRNHPQTRHFCSDVFEVDPETVIEGQPIGLLWASPDCKHFSKAKGGKPVSKRVRGLAWVVTKWASIAEERRPRVICLENVEEFKDWGPLDANNMPDAAKKGRTFKRWVRTLEHQGYKVEHRELRACDYGAPTIRRRLFLVARRDGLPIEWPAPTHAKKPTKGLKPWRTAAECIDWNIACPSIFERKKPLAEATLRRIAHGIQRYVIDNPKPFIVPVTHTQAQPTARSVDQPLSTITTARGGEFALITPTLVDAGHADAGPRSKRWGKGYRAVDSPLNTVTASGASMLVMPTLVNTANGGTTGRGPNTWSTEEPLRTVTAAPSFAIASATLVQTGYGERPGQAPRVPGIDKPLGTVVDGAKHAVVAATLIKHFGGKPAAGRTCASLEHPAPTVTASDHSSVAAATLIKLRGTSNSADVRAPLATVTAGGNHAAAVYAFLVKYFGTDQDPRLTDPLHTCTTKARFALVTVDGEAYYIRDIGLRMLKPRELFNAQSFPSTYEIDHGAAGEAFTAEQKIRMCGNSVCPVLAKAVVESNYGDAYDARMRQAA